MESNKCKKKKLSASEMNEKLNGMLTKMNILKTLAETVKIIIEMVYK